jgi:hypothetical protein
MRLPILLFALAFAFATPALAQAPKPVDPAALAQAKVFLEKSGSAALSQQMINGILTTQKASLEQANPGKTAEVNEVIGLMQAEFAKEIPAMIDAMAAVYARHFTKDELTEVTAFYDSPVGRKMVKEMPLIVSESMTVAQSFGQKIAVEVLTKLKPEFEKRKLKTSRT